MGPGPSAKTELRDPPGLGSVPAVLVVLLYSTVLLVLLYSTVLLVLLYSTYMYYYYVQAGTLLRHVLYGSRRVSAVCVLTVFGTSASFPAQVTRDVL